MANSPQHPPSPSNYFILFPVLPRHQERLMTKWGKKWSRKKREHQKWDEPLLLHRNIVDKFVMMASAISCNGTPPNKAGRRRRKMEEEGVGEE